MLDRLKEAMYHARREWRREDPCNDPVIKIVFSPAGFCKAAAAADAQHCFSNPNVAPDTVLGYPYSVDRELQDDFKILVS